MINFPTTIDSLTNPTASDSTVTVSHSGQHSNANDAIEALQTKVGVNSSAVTSSLDYKVSNVASVNPGHKHSMAAGMSDVNISSVADGDVLVYNTSQGKWINNTTDAPDSSTTVKGVGKIDSAPSVAANPIFANAENTKSGTILSSSNKIIDDANTTGTGSIVRSSLLVDIQHFLTSGTWTKPTGAKFVKVVCIGGGAGGGPGTNENSVGGYGGSGGAGGAYASRVFDASSLSSTETVTVGTGGASNTDGVASSFGTSIYLTARGGLKGLSGGARGGAGLAGGSGQNSNGETHYNGGNGGNVVDTDGVAGVSTETDLSPRGGGGGGTGGGGARSGGAGGGFTQNYVKAGGTAASDTAGGAGSSTAKELLMGGVGGGGGGSAAGTGAGKIGGAGGFPGGGGGGGGGSYSSTAGAGGAGADGLVAVITYF